MPLDTSRFVVGIFIVMVSLTARVVIWDLNARRRKSQPDTELAVAMGSSYESSVYIAGY
jgi:hypothetical protein